MSRRKLPLEVCFSIFESEKIKETLRMNCGEIIFFRSFAKLMDGNHTLATVDSNHIEWIRKTPKKGQL